MLFVLFAAVLISVCLKQILAKKSENLKNLLVMVIGILVILEFNFPMTFVHMPQKSEFPKVYSYVNELPKGSPIVEMPIYNWNMFPYATQELIETIILSKIFIR